MLRTAIFKSYCDKSPEDLTKKEEKLRLELLEDSGNLKVMRELGQLLYYTKDIPGAMKIYKKLIEINPKNANFQGFLGYLHYELEHYKEAIESIEKAIEIDPKESFLRFLLGNACSRIGRIKDAAFHYNMAIVLDLDMYQAHIDFATKYEEMGRFDKALREYRAASEIQIGNEEVKQKIALLEKRHESV